MRNYDLVLHLICAEVWMFPGRRRFLDMGRIRCEECIVLVFGVFFERYFGVCVGVGEMGRRA